MKRLLLVLIIASQFAACKNADRDTNETPDPPADEPPTLLFSIINTYPHDSTFFTEGLEFHNGQLFESSGGDDSSSPHPSAFGVANLKSGRVEKKVNIDSTRYFGEGITFFGNKVYQLTWQNGVGFVYDPATYKKLRQFRVPAAQGWGMTHDSTHVIMSDGTSNVYFLDPDSLRIQKTITVSDNRGPLSNVNELDYNNGYLYANQWQTPYILKIDPATGKVKGRVDLTQVLNEIESKYPDTNGLNGIAYNAQTNSFFITGKNWPLIYEIRLQ